MNQGLFGYPLREEEEMQVLQDAPTIYWGLGGSRIAMVTLGGNRTMEVRGPMKRGVYILHVIQDGTGSRTLAFDSDIFKWPLNVTPILTTVAGERDIFSFVCEAGSGGGGQRRMYGSHLKGYP